MHKVFPCRDVTMVLFPATRVTNCFDTVLNKNYAPGHTLLKQSYEHPTSMTQSLRIYAEYNLAQYHLITQTKRNKAVCIFYGKDYMRKEMPLNSLSPGRYGCDFKCSIWKRNLAIDILNSSNGIVLARMPQDDTDTKSTLVQVMT